MELTAKILDGRIVFDSTNLSKNELYKLEGKEVVVTIKKKVKRRSNSQNNAFHLYFRQLADKLNESGFDMKKTLRADYDIPWTEKLIKMHLWKPIMEAHLGKESTKDLTSSEVDNVYDILNRALGEKTGVYVPFPSVETLIQNETIY